MTCQSDLSVFSLGAILQSGTSQSLSLLSVNDKKPWILDLGANDHLSRSYDNFLSYLPIVGNEKIQIAYGSLTPIAGKSHIHPIDGLTLKTACTQNYLTIYYLFVR